MSLVLIRHILCMFGTALHLSVGTMYMYHGIYTKK